MSAFWKNYRSYPRLAVVSMQGEDVRLPLVSGIGDRLLIDTDHVEFAADGYGCPRADICHMEELRTGDIVSVNDRGILYRLFSKDDDDATVFVTGHCNSNCVMCPASDYERKHDSGMSSEWTMEYLDLLPDDIGHITVTGGEPTLRTELFFAVMRKIADRFPEIETLLLTNGRSFASKKMTERLMEYCPQFLRVAIPIHGSEDALHDRITQAPGSLRQTRMGIDHLLAAGVSVEIRVVVSRLNAHDLLSIADDIISRFPGIMVVNFIGLETRGSCAKHFKDVYLELSEAVRMILPAVNRLAGAGIDAALYNYPLCCVDRGYWSVCKKSISPGKVQFPAACAACDVKSLCGGFFDTTLSMARPAVRPIRF